MTLVADLGRCCIIRTCFNQSVKHLFQVTLLMEILHAISTSKVVSSFLNTRLHGSRKVRLSGVLVNVV